MKELLNRVPEEGEQPRAHQPRAHKGVDLGEQLVREASVSREAGRRAHVLEDIGLGGGAHSA